MRKAAETSEQIYELTTLAAGDLSLQEVLDKLAAAAVRITGVKACSIRLLDESTGRLRIRSTFGLSEDYLQKGEVTRDDPVVRQAFAGEAVVLDDLRVDSRIRFRDITIKEGLFSQLTVAMRFRHQPIGVLRLYSGRVRGFAPDDITLARAVASQCAVAVTNARLYAEAIEGARMAEQIRLASHVQRRMIPESPPLVAGLDIAANYVPCFAVGGDFYDFIRIDETRLVVAIADVIGKGMPAAIMMSSFRMAVRIYADTFRGSDIGSIIQKLNQTACEECRDNEFVTLFYGVVDVREPSITYCNCGHEPPLLFNGATVSSLQTGGIVLGVERDASYEVETRLLKDGEVLLLYTDGLVDAVNFEGELWGRDRLILAALNFGGGRSEQVASNILRYRRRFVGLANQMDDTSLIVVKIDRRAEPDFLRRCSY